MQAALRTGLTARSSFGARINVASRSIVSVAPRPSLVSSYAAPSSSFLGSVAPTSLFRPQPAKGRGALLVMANAKKSMGDTLRGTRRARARTSGFRARMASATGRKVLAARRKRGRKTLTPASVKLSGGKK